MSARINTAMCMLLVLTGCGDEDGVSTEIGATGMLAGAEVSTWARIDNGRVDAIGVTIPMAAIAKANKMEALDLVFPEAVRAQTFFDHLGIDFNPQGHGPPPYAVPHFDVHFYGITVAEKKQIDCMAEPMPAAARMPAPYIIPGTGMEPDGTCVPNMGVHAIDPTSPELDPQAPAPFTYTMILGYHAGKLAFFEPMVTRDYLEQGIGFVASVNRPSDPSPVDRWPRQASGSYDPSRKVYEIVLSDLE